MTFGVPLVVSIKSETPARERWNSDLVMAKF
jgi:hypothetical protein